MSRNSKWRLENTKVKVVFRLQFHATHIPQSGWDKLFISFISADSGKTTAKTTKANVRNGTCKWADPIYETTRLLQDSKSKQYEEKLYKIVVSMGSSRASILGEAIMNLADYVDAVKPSSVALPLHGCNFGTILHITVQLLTSKTGFREFEQQRELREGGLQSGVDNHHGESTTGKPYSEEITNDQIDKVSAKVKLKADSNDLSSVEEEVNMNEDYADSNSAAGFDGSSNTSESLNAEKHDIDCLKSHTSHSQSPLSENINNELAVAYEENNRLRVSLELAESSFYNLKLEVTSLENIADQLGTETQKFSHILAAEISSTEELAKEVSAMKSECLKFKDDVIKLRELNISPKVPLIETSDNQFVSKNGFGIDLCQPESILQHFNVVPPVSNVANPADIIDAMKTEIFDLVRELDEAKVEKEALTQKMSQMECYYEALVQELEENQKLMLGELQHLRNEHSTCLYTLSSSRVEMESMRQDMNQQMLQFANERSNLNALNEELERRATTSEAALRRARLNYSIAVDKLQKDLELLSSQVVSIFQTNESLIKQAFKLPSNPHVEEDQKLVQTRDIDDAKKLSYQKVEEELIDMYSENLNLDIYSKALQGSLLEANADITIMKKKMDELVKELELSTASQNELMVRLEKAKEDIYTLDEYKSSCISQCSDMALQNQLSQDKLESISEENHLLVQKLKDSETIIMEYTNYQSKFETCLAENAKLSLSLKELELENEKLQYEMSIVKENFMILKAESEEVVSSKKNLEENTIFVQDKLANLLESYNMHIGVLPNSDFLDYRSTELKDAILQLEEIQHDACGKIVQLTEENQNLEREKVIADEFLNAARSEIDAIKQKFKSDIQGMEIKLNVSNTLVGKLQAEIESVASKLQFSSEIEEKYAQQNTILLADLVLLEDQMQELTCKNGHVSREISGLDALDEELGTSKSTITELIHDKQKLAMSLKDKTEECVKLASNVNSLEEDFRILNHELCMEKGYKDDLEGKVRDLTFQLNKNNDKLLDFEQEKVELLHVRKLASDLEVEKSRLAHLLSQQNLLIENLQNKISCQESQLLEMHEYSMAADVKLAYFANQYETFIEELLQQLTSSEGCLMELQKRYHDLEAISNSCIVNETHWSEEKADLLRNLESLRSDLEVSEAQNKLLSDSNNDIKDQNEKMESEIEKLKKLIIDAEEEIIFLAVSKEELEILVIVLKGKLIENFADIEEYKDEVMMLCTQCNQLSRKLSEQVLKTEEFKNFCTHLKELKDKAEAECNLSREKREGPPVAVQDSLRIAFIKEQCETKVQELKQQLSICQKHGEDMLLKLQDAIDEIEDRKKSEAVNLKRNDELSLKLLELETELQSVVTEKREKINSYDRTKAELECALLSLECCKEEKEKLEASLREFEAEKSELANELSLVKEQLENSILAGQSQLQIAEDTTSKGMNQIHEELVTGESPKSNGNNLAVNGESFGAQILRSSMEHLHEELRKMKHENTSHHQNHDGRDLLIPEREIMQLHKANEELGSMFPSFNEISGDGNALERVLALEIELAEALKAKNKSNIQFQSSFLKQHSNEEAVLKSFRNINELIEEMLELKGRHASLEAELRDMHDRYSELSLQFAEVEGERQKLKMTLKNVRSSKKLLTLNRSSSDIVMDHAT
ncbi:hypothetical protein ACJIZ3_002158 [Penstemon smallii]|uniref:C2 NT-type domain-containing protein n=1 Tax=Penstemon smallii TaxID=265156 RepID=A0ABD3U711_9LAMI